MLDAFLEHPFFLNRHRQAPLLKERESFLNHLQQQGTSRKALRNLSAELLQVVRLLKLNEMRDVSLEEIRRATQRWTREQRTDPKAHSYGNSARFFAYAAKKWLRFHGRLKLPGVPPMRFADQLSDFARYMTEEKASRLIRCGPTVRRHQGSWNGSGSDIGCWPGRGSKMLMSCLQ